MRANTEGISIDFITIDSEARAPHVSLDDSGQEATCIITCYEEKKIVKKGENIYTFCPPKYNQLANDLREHLWCGRQFSRNAIILVILVLQLETDEATRTMVKSHMAIPISMAEKGDWIVALFSHVGYVR
jgi:hypothetical protein